MEEELPCSQGSYLPQYFSFLYSLPQPERQLQVDGGLTLFSPVSPVPTTVPSTEWVLNICFVNK